jgi:hypothetical protein
MSEIKYNNHYYCEKCKKNTFSYPYVTKPKISESQILLNFTYLTEGFSYWNNIWNELFLVELHYKMMMVTSQLEEENK